MQICDIWSLSYGSPFATSTFFEIRLYPEEKVVGVIVILSYDAIIIQLEWLDFLLK